MSSPSQKPEPPPLVRGLFLGLGVLCIATAAVGLVLPLIPVTFPTLLAGYFFARSSPRFDRWLTEHRLFGPIIRDWRAGAGFTVRAKVIATIGIVASFVFTGTVAITSTTGRLLLAALALCICAYVISRPTKRPGDAARPESEPEAARPAHGERPAG
ncbi:YbaN family protein [Haliangium ochraceum]|uniref:DUF454 domain-containing protein n=1 Tax=Haliangium ochraceum (strain DSM 14365 / JCM 11303 / SMP-2) TaxID=502025 RepID=D0LXW8_HALO1|nr:YbaN family protein [Haliangium ochraceum]ACY14323.1 protein of unknown function DUF454 [Haliangium ochraceum DSM 14365]